MARPANYPLPLVSGSRRASSLRCESCFHIGAAVRVSSKLLCGECFLDVSMNEESRRSGADDRRSRAGEQRVEADAAYDHVA
jgi:hypothetical protein